MDSLHADLASALEHAGLEPVPLRQGDPEEYLSALVLYMVRETWRRAIRPEIWYTLFLSSSTAAYLVSERIRGNRVPGFMELFTRAIGDAGAGEAFQAYLAEVDALGEERKTQIKQSISPLLT